MSWLRRRDGQLLLLSVGVEVYNTDGRVTAHFAPPNDWQLRLTAAQDRDQGGYECQVSSHPPIVQTVHLHVVGMTHRETRFVIVIAFVVDK